MGKMHCKTRQRKPESELWNMVALGNICVEVGVGHDNVMLFFYFLPCFVVVVVVVFVFFIQYKIYTAS